MRRILMALAIAVFMACSMVAFAQTTQSQKDECLLASRNCKAEVNDIYQRMKKLDKEIRKGTRVYTPEELRKLQEKLAETRELLENLEKPGH